MEEIQPKSYQTDKHPAIEKPSNIVILHGLLVRLVGEAFARCPVTRRQREKLSYQLAAFTLTTDHEKYMHSGNTAPARSGSARPTFIFQPLNGKALLLICVHFFVILFSLLVTITSNKKRITTVLPVMQAQNYQLAKISSNLRHLVRRDGRTQRQIAEAAGLNPVYVNRWIKGQRMPSDENLQKMAEILGVTITDITEGITESREVPKDKRELEVELFEWRERALVAETKLAHLQSACAALGQHVSALGLTVKNFSDIISE